MAYRSNARARVDPTNPRAFAICDRCGVQVNHYMLQWQYQWTGMKLTNLRLLVCDECLDKPAEFLRTVILPADPAPLFNVRPGNFSIDETDFRVTEDVDQRITEENDDRVLDSSSDEGTTS